MREEPAGYALKGPRYPSGVKKILLFGLVISLWSMGAPVGADQQGFRDGDEQPFCESPGPCPDSDYMDFRWLTQGHGDDSRRLRQGVRTAERWRTGDLDGRHGTTFAFDFDTDEHGDVDLQLRVRRKDGRWRAYFYSGKYFGRHVPGKVNVWRPGRRSLKVGFSADVLGDAVGFYRWRVAEYQRGVGCAGSCHSDDAPDSGWYEHRA
jgi:hypothetical protein